AESAARKNFALKVRRGILSLTSISSVPVHASRKRLPTPFLSTRPSFLNGCRRALQEFVPKLLDGDQRLGEQGYLLTQPTNVDVNRRCPTVVLVAPNIAQKHIARQHPSPMLQQIFQQQILLCGEGYVLPVARHGVLRGIDDEAAVPDRARLLVCHPIDTT